MPPSRLGSLVGVAWKVALGDPFTDHDERLTAWPLHLVVIVTLLIVLAIVVAAGGSAFVTYLFMVGAHG